MKEELKGLTLQVSAIFDRLEALKKALPKESLDKYLQLIEEVKREIREKYDVNEKQLDEWYR